MYIKLTSFFKNYKYFLLYSALTPVICMALIYTVRKYPRIGQLYASYIFPIFPNTLGRLFSPLPFSVMEIGLYTISFFIIIALLIILLSIFHKKARKKLLLYVPRMVITTLCFCSTIFLMITLSCSINYSRDGIAKDINIVPGMASHDNLVDLCLLLINDITSLDSGSTEIKAINTASLQNDTKQAMMTLGKKYPSLKGYYPNPKPVIMSSWMSDIDLTGLFSPYTIEANYNNDVVDYIKPYTICHELAHLRGYICEDDAGFIAYLACSHANSRQMRYSGTMNALSFVLNALQEDSSPEEFQQILNQIPEKALIDLEKNQDYWQGHEGTISRISEAANDTYLKANAQAGGTKSYGRMVDLLLAYYGLNSQSV
ncbi:DUF3810 family protein [Aminipila terrae]|uniref:DUF3810 family protein n=2 Tax=Aminipila terrae TaxID=2697030 RepID=A0A6P1ME65_9FIRM|nr:DUF3810 family protein [Aminipila terrae]